MPLTAVQEKLKTIPDEYMDEVYNYLELLQYKIIYKKQYEESAKKFPNRRPDILKQPNFLMRNKPFFNINGSGRTEPVFWLQSWYLS